MERSQPGRLLFFVHGTDKTNKDFLARTGLVYRLNWAVWAELGWGGLGWAGLGRTGLGQTGLGRTMGLAELSWSGPNWTGLGRTGLGWVSLYIVKCTCTVHLPPPTCAVHTNVKVWTYFTSPHSQGQAIIATDSIRLLEVKCSIFRSQTRFPIVDQAKIEYAIVNIDWWINSIAIKSANMSLLPRYMYTIE